LAPNHARLGDYPVAEHRLLPLGHLGRQRLVFFNGERRLI
jgi:hypothetical protein